ncbi:hypothetical protein CHUAL_009075 [Chamberlinius hualienensis]
MIEFFTMSISVVTVAVVAVLCFGTSHSASISESKDCPITEVVANFNQTIDDCVNQVVGEGDPQKLETVKNMVKWTFMAAGMNKTDDNTKTTQDFSNTEIADAFEAYFCIMQDVVKQSPELAVMSFDCAKNVPSNVTDSCEVTKDITSCFTAQLKQSCADFRKKRSIANAINRI